MIGKLGLAAAALMISASSAFAESCGSMPVSPDIPTTAEIMQKSPADAATTRHNAFLDIKNWQSGLKTYRDCLESLSADDTRNIQRADAKKDADKITQWTSDKKAANAAYDQSAATEQSVVAEFTSMRNAYCSRKDVDLSSCPKQQ